MSTRDQWRLVAICVGQFVGLALLDFGSGLTWQQIVGVFLLILFGSQLGLLTAKLRREQTKRDHVADVADVDRH